MLKRPVTLAGGAVLALVLLVAGCAAPPPTPPSYSGNFPDPSVVLSGSTYYAFATQDGDGSQSNIQRISSSSLDGGWNSNALAPPSTREALPSANFPRWATPGATWAPSVMRVGSTWLMYYTVHDVATNTQCISVATSTAAAPNQAFTDTSSGPLVCINAGSIDPAPFRDPASGRLYLSWAAMSNGIPAIWGQELDPTTGRTMRSGSTAAVLLSRDQTWEGGTVEGPGMARSPNGKYDLFYSANNWTTASYAVGYAECATPVSGCVKKSLSGPWFGANRPNGPKGPGGEDLFTDTSGKLQMAYHAWGQIVGYTSNPATTGRRMLWISTIAFTTTGQPIAPNP